MIGESMALDPSASVPSREEVEARLEALSARVLSRRKTDRRAPAPRIGHNGDTTALETAARLRALEARLIRTGGDL